MVGPRRPGRMKASIPMRAWAAALCQTGLGNRTCSMFEPASVEAATGAARTASCCLPAGARTTPYLSPPPSRPRPGPDRASRRGARSRSPHHTRPLSSMPRQPDQEPVADKAWPGRCLGLRPAGLGRAAGCRASKRPTRRAVPRGGPARESESWTQPRSSAPKFRPAAGRQGTGRAPAFSAPPPPADKRHRNRVGGRGTGPARAAGPVPARETRIAERIREGP